MRYKEDADRSRERMKAFFAGEVVDRAVIQVYAPKKGHRPASAWHGWYLVQNLDHPERIVDEFEKWCEGMFFGGEAFPNMATNLGPGSAAAYLGCEVRIAPDTVWFLTPKPWGWDRILSLRVDPRNRWWEATRKVMDIAVERGRDNWYVQAPDLGAVMNILGSMRGTQTLLEDTLTHPEEIKQGANLLLKHVIEYYDESLRIAQRYLSGSMAWMGIWNPGRGSDVQCDFSAMISPGQFAEFVVPQLREQCRQLDQSIYHWDGPGQIPHFDQLLEIPELGGIQWIPGVALEGAGSPRWFPFYRRMQEHGKRVVLQGVAPREVEPILSSLSPKGLMMTTSCDSEDEARDLLRRVETWTHT